MNVVVVASKILTPLARFFDCSRMDGRSTFNVRGLYDDCDAGCLDLNLYKQLRCEKGSSVGQFGFGKWFGSSI